MIRKKGIAPGKLAVCFSRFSLKFYRHTLSYIKLGTILKESLRFFTYQINALHMRSILATGSSIFFTIIDGKFTSVK